MKRKILAFSITLCLSLLFLFGPRHPGGDLPFSSFGHRSPLPGINRVERDPAAVVVAGTPLRLSSGWTGGCGEELTFESQVNCALYLLNHPGLWFGR